MTRPLLPVSVVIASRNRPRLLADTVASILSGDALPAALVVVDQSDHGQPPPEWHVHDPVRLQHIRSRSRGLSRARNTGAAASREPLLVFTDDDMRASPGWLEALTMPLLEGERAVVVTGRVVPGASETTGGFVPAVVESTEPAIYSGRLTKDVLAGGNMAITRESFFRVGGFDERLGAGSAFPAAEDNDLGLRLLTAGFRIVFLPQALLEHRAWRPAHDYVTLRFDYGRGKGAFYVKHTRATDLYGAQRMARDLFRRAYRAVRFVHHPRMAAGELAYAAGVLRGAAEWTLRQPPAPEHSGTSGHEQLLHDRPVEER